MDPAWSATLAAADELELVTTGRASGQAHTVRLRFVYGDGVIWLRTGERASAPDARGVRRRTESDRTSDWLRNLEREPDARVRIGDAQFRVRYEPSEDPETDLRRAVDLLREKYGAEWVGDWYLDAGRIPVKLRLEAPAGF